MITTTSNSKEQNLGVKVVFFLLPPGTENKLEWPLWWSQQSPQLAGESSALF